MSTTISTRVPQDIAKEIEGFAEEEHVDKSTMTRKLLADAIEKKRIENALKKYKDKEVGLGRAAELAKVPLRRMMKELKDRKITVNYTLQDLREDYKAAVEYDK